MHMAQQQAGAPAVPTAMAPPGVNPVAGALTGDSSLISRPGHPGIAPPCDDTDPNAPLPPGFVASLGAEAGRYVPSVSQAAGGFMAGANMAHSGIRQLSRQLSGEPAAQAAVLLPMVELASA